MWRKGNSCVPLARMGIGLATAENGASLEVAQKRRFRLPLPEPRRCGFNPWVEKILWRRAWQPTPVFLPGGLRSVGSQSWTRLQQLSTCTQNAENNMKVLQEIKNRTAYNPAIPLLGIYLMEIKSLSQRNICCIHCGIIHNSQDVEVCTIHTHTHTHTHTSKH